MYARYFGLGRRPFSLAPDPRFLYLSERHREALAHLLYGLGGGGGFVVLTGEIGAGKTTVARCFLEQLPKQCVVAYIFNPCLSVIELLQTVCGEFGLAPLPANATVKAHVDALNTFLLDAHAKGRHALLVVDEAQLLEASVLEQLRLLTNLETTQRKLLQIVLIGQPELRDLLARPGLEQLAQRVIARYHLGPLSAAETRLYVLHRLGVAGPDAPVPFSEAALARLHRLTGGVPRRINLLADRALLGAYGRRTRQVDAKLVDGAAAEVFDGRGSAPAWGLGRRLAQPAAVAAALAGVLLLGLAAWGFWMQEQPTGVAALASPPAPQGVVAASAPPASPPPVAAAPEPPPLAAAPDPQPVAATQEPPASNDPSALLGAALDSEALAWRELALHWDVAIGEGEPCLVAAQAQLACFRSRGGGFQLVRQLDRPVVLTLRRPGGGEVYALLVGLDERRATLHVGRQRFDMTLSALAGVWRGALATFWRTPPGWRSGAGASLSASTREWVEAQLATQGPGQVGRPLRDRVAVFQLVQGLPPDGVAGPMTLMQLNRSAGVAEPRLAGAARP